MKLISLFLGCSLASFANPAVTFLGASQTQAVVAIRAATGPCKLGLSDDTAQQTGAPDVDDSKYAGASTDTGRSDTITLQDGSRIVTLGHMTGDRALAAATKYSLQISGCGGSAKLSFSTANIKMGTTQAWPVPFDPGKWGNRGWPVTAKSLVTKARYVDPLTGVILAPASNALDWTVRYPGGGHKPVGSGTLNFAYWAGGFGWANPATVVTGAASTASVNNTNPIDLYPGTEATPVDAPYLQWSLSDIAAKLFGSGTDGQAVNRQFTVCVFVNPIAGCLGQPVSITAGHGGTPGLIKSNSSDPDTPWPGSFPQALFAGWGSDVMIHTEDRATSGTLTAANGVLTIDGTPSYTNHFSSALEAGNKIYVSGTEPVCAHNLCTVSRPRSATQVVVAENITKPTGTAFVALRFGIRIQKVTSTGSITVGATYKLAGSINVNSGGGAENTRCGTGSLTTGDKPPKTGYICSVATTHGGVNLWYFFATDGTARPLYAGKVPNQSYFSTTLHWDASDIPSFKALCCGYSYFPGADARTWFVYGPSGGGKLALYSIHYDGDTTEDRDWRFTMTPGADGDIQYPPNDKWTWKIVVGSANSLSSQIAANFPKYDQAMYGTRFSLVGVSGTTAYFQNLYNARQDTGSWLAVVDVSSGKGVLTNLIHTVDGTGTKGYMRFGGLHNDTAPSFPPDTQRVSNNPLTRGDTTLLHGGPFAMPITGVMRGARWSTNTTVPWPIDASYDNACPPGNAYEAAGAKNNQCVTLRVPAGGWCNTSPRADELARWGCPIPKVAVPGWNPAQYAQPFPIQVGDVFIDSAIDGDAEHFRVIGIDKNIEPDGQYRVVVQRNAMWDYCCIDDGTKPGSSCVDGAGQNRHTSGWKAIAYPPNRNGCTTGVFVIGGKTETGMTIAEIGRSLQGAGDLVAGTSPNTAAYISATVATPQKPMANLLDMPVAVTALAPPTFHGAVLPIGGGAVQSQAASPGSVPWFTDSNTLNNNYGCCREGLGLIGKRDLTPTATAAVYKIAALGTVNYKIFPLLGFAGRYNLKDVSGPASTVATAPFTLCYALKTGECYSGSKAGEIYVNVPGAYDPGGCAVNQHWANVPCVLSGWPGAGGFRQQAWQSADKKAGSRFLTYLFDIPGGQYAHSTLTPLDASVAWGSPTFVEGWGQVTWLVRLPPWEQDDSAPRNDLLQVPVQVPAGPEYAEVQFGYSRWIGPAGSPSSFRCMPRTEACNTSGEPYNFEGESRKLTSCAAGCTINIPAMAPNIVYYRVRRSSDGITWTNGEINAAAVP